MDVEIEWGFQPGTEKKDFDGHVESFVGMIGSVAPLAGDKSTKVKDAHTWQSRGVRGARRGIVVPLLCTSEEPVALDTRVTVWSGTNGFTFRPRDLEQGPILIPEHGVFVTKAGSGATARQFARELAAKHLKSIRQMTREHREAASWDELMQEVRLWTCPEGTKAPPFPQVGEPAMQVQLPDPRWTEMWRQATEQLRGPHLWPNLAHEVGRVVRAMELVGLHEETLKVYDYFLQSPGVKSDGDYADGKGSLEWAKSMRHDMGYSHEGTHASTGRMLFSIAERYFLTGDKVYFQTNRARLQAAADWIIRERNSYMKDIPNRKDLMAYFLLPKIAENSNIYLLEDDVPNFLRYWMNHYALIVGANGKMWEHWRLPGGWPNSLAVGDYAPCATPDNGAAGWFIENFRNLLVMEDGPSLWVARATPRAWLAQGAKVAVSNAPTYFGNLAYEIVSDADHGRITATVEIPSRHPPRSILLRLRHPQAAPIKRVQVNGKRWTRFNSDKEVIELTGLTGTATVTATYR